MHTSLLLIGIFQVSVFAQLYPGQVNVAVNVFLHNKNHGSVKVQQLTPKPLPEMGSVPALLESTGFDPSSPALLESTGFKPPFPDASHQQRLKLACDALLRSPPHIRSFLMHQLFLCQHLFNYDIRDMEEPLDGKQYDAPPGIVSRVSNGLFNITVVFCIQDNCSTMHIDEASNVQSLQSNSSANFTNVTIIAGVVPILFDRVAADMPLLTHLSMDSIGIEMIEAGAFDNLPNIKNLSLQDNNILMIKSDTFSPLTSLEELHLEHNSIVAVSPHSFANMTNLKVLSLSNNVLETYSEDWFQNNLKLRELRLDQNELTKIPKNAFRNINFKNNISIYLDRNKIESIGPNLFGSRAKNNVWLISLNFNKFNCIEGNLKNFFVSSHVYLIGNPLSCDCLQKIVSFTYHNAHPGISLSPVADCGLAQH